MKGHAAAKWTKIFLIVALVSAALCLTTQFISLSTGHQRLFGLRFFFDMDYEASFPTWFNSFLWFLVSLLAWTISSQPHEQARKLSKNWKAVAAIFLFLSIDEVMASHEFFGVRIHDIFQTSDYLNFAFLIPGSFLTLVFILSNISLLRTLPKRTCYGMLTAGGVYLMGQIVLEAIAGNWQWDHTHTDPIYDRDYVYVLLMVTEEFLEMAGIILMFRTLMLYLESIVPDKKITVKF